MGVNLSPLLPPRFPRLRVSPLRFLRPGGKWLEEGIGVLRGNHGALRRGWRDDVETAQGVFVLSVWFFLYLLRYVVLSQA